MSLLMSECKLNMHIIYAKVIIRWKNISADPVFLFQTPVVSLWLVEVSYSVLSSQSILCFILEKITSSLLCLA